MIINILVISTLALLPIYIFKSGGYQLVDLSIILCIIAAVLSKSDKDDLLLNKAYALLPFVIWAILLNIGYALIYPKMLLEVSYAMVFVLYNFVIFFSFIILFNRLVNNQNIIYIYIGLIISVFLCFFVKGEYEEGLRNALSFNNPNQLGYFSIILMSYFIVLFDLRYNFNLDNTFYRILGAIIIIAAHIFIILSISRASAVAIIILDIWLLKNILKKEIMIDLSFGFIILILFFVIYGHSFIKTQLEARPGRNIQEMDSEEITQSLQERVFRHFTNMRGWQIIVGMGGTGIEGDKMGVSLLKRDRFAIEVHNTFGAVLKIYGIIGLIFFGFWIMKMLKYTYPYRTSLFIWFAILMQNMTHNGIRFRSAWIFLAFLLVAANLLREGNNNTIIDDDNTDKLLFKKKQALLK